MGGLYYHARSSVSPPDDMEQSNTLEFSVFASCFVCLPPSSQRSIGGAPLQHPGTLFVDQPHARSMHSFTPSEGLHPRAVQDSRAAWWARGSGAILRNSSRIETRPFRIAPKNLGQLCHLSSCLSDQSCCQDEGTSR